MGRKQHAFNTTWPGTQAKSGQNPFDIDHDDIQQLKIAPLDDNDQEDLRVDVTAHGYGWMMQHEEKMMSSNQFVPLTGARKETRVCPLLI